VCNRIVQSVFLVTALFLVSAGPASAQTASVGLALLGDNGGAGIAADYSNQLRTMSSDRTLGWLVDLSFNHHGESLLGFDASLNTFIVEVGARLAGKAGDKATWHVQGAFGVAHQGVGGDIADSCDLVGIDCGNTGAIFTPAGALTYWFSGNKGVKGQLGIPIFFSGGDSTTRFDISFVWRMGQ
jgi:hypothetical protein